MDKKVFAEVQKRGHEQVAYFNYPEVGLRAIVAIHNSVLGPALGGCRVRAYESEDQALDDVLRLSEGMTYKSSLAGLNLGGGKAVVLVDPNVEFDRRKLFLKLAECLNALNGRYITAEDFGTSVPDVMVMREVSKYAAGYARELGGAGDPSPFTALGVFQGMLACCERRYGSRDLKGKHVTVQGCGHVGQLLMGHLVKAGAKITVSDTKDSAIQEAKAAFPNIEAVGSDAIYDVKCDIYSPNAIGQTVNQNTLGRLKCDIIAGGANNQLTDASVHSIITERKIVYAPDFAINAGGVISVGAEYNPGGWKESWAMEKTMNIFNTIHRILGEAEARHKFPEIVAVELAKERIAEAAKKKVVASPSPANHHYQEAAGF